MRARATLLFGSILALLAVALGAFGAHALKTILLTNKTTDIFETASQYHFIHALALLWLGQYQRTLNFNEKHYLSLASYLFLAGTLIFSGSLYCLAISNVRWLGAITPIGGILLLSAWFAIVLHLIKQRG